MSFRFLNVKALREVIYLEDNDSELSISRCVRALEPFYSGLIQAADIMHPTNSSPSGTLELLVPRISHLPRASLLPSSVIGMVWEEKEEGLSSRG